MGTTLKARLGRLLGAKSRFRKSSTLATVPEVETLSTSSAASDKSDDDSVLFYYPSGSDPFADVRERMEELANRDRQRFVGNATTTTACEDNESVAKSMHAEEGIPPVVAYFVYLSYAVLIFMGHLRDFLAAWALFAPTDWVPLGQSPVLCAVAQVVGKLFHAAIVQSYSGRVQSTDCVKSWRNHFRFGTRKR
jgi:hypothetical protein